MKNNKFIRIALIIAACLLIGFVSFKAFTPNSDGTITVEVVKLDGTIDKSKDIDFNEGEKLVDLISENFDNFDYSTSEFGTFVNGIESIKNASDFSTFVSIYVDDKMSEVGLDSIEFKDGTLISFRDMKNTYNG